MNEQITAIQHFLTHGELRITRDQDIYRILSIDEWGKASVYKNQDYTRRTLTLARKEVADLASLCFPPQEK